MRQDDQEQGRQEPGRVGDGDGLFAARLRALARPLSPAMRRVVRFIEADRAAVLTGSAADLARRIGTSDATVIRTVQMLGFAGLADLRRMVAASLAPGAGDPAASPAARMARTLEAPFPEQGAAEPAAAADPDLDGALDAVFAAHAEAIEALRAPASRQRITAAIRLLAEARRIVLFGIGPSAPLARYAALQFARAGRAARVLDRSGTDLADQLLDLRPGDALLMLSYGRPYREALATAGEARRLRLPLLLVTGKPPSGLAGQADLVLPVPRGRADQVALHGATLVLLEAIALGLAAAGGGRTLAALARLNDLRGAVTGAAADL